MKDFEYFETQKIEALDNLIQLLEQSLSQLQNSAYKDAYILSQIEKYKVEIPKLRKQQDEYKSYVKISTKHLAEANKNQSAHKALREELKINHDNLKKIDSPDALNQIWKMIKMNNPDLEHLELDDFFQLKKKFNLKGEFYLFQKVNIIYTMLNLIGYYQDEDINKKEKKFIASFSDMSHASYGCFCHYLITRDKKFAKKTAVAYEYLNIATQVVVLEVIKKQNSQS